MTAIALTGNSFISAAFLSALIRLWNSSSIFKRGCLKSSLIVCFLKLSLRDFILLWNYSIIALIMANKLGIDLGTTNILVFVPGRGIVLNEPSVVAVSEDNKILAIGTEAKNMIGRTPENIIAYRPMKDGVIADYRVTEAMLRYYIDKALGKWNIFKPDVLISVPAGGTSTERHAGVEAAIKAGAKNAYVVKEPILAAIGAGIPIQEAAGHMIVDVGGGTKDVGGHFPGGLFCSPFFSGGGKEDPGGP